jgi:hypothetical protein
MKRSKYYLLLPSADLITEINFGAKTNARTTRTIGANAPTKLVPAVTISPPVIGDSTVANGLVIFIPPF